ncbi:bifunctional ADP-dependent NAD(P)H-hydrate dehydratase/NAD(P)H-hydrate epimerase [Desulforegula conservatrix]|uniref:bifunctional ADP-dependent NAD(P)H-hydrate dehydratase/NAD(P)H-hydrate epimerase n=1 Tax=Desulforegula conservatrix TaxID=153026 RepID=UPI00040A73D7|nr:bifunctional ADP-dependent NAD(P)H-hydrate dehydratase/NAD(P)H-hydrate epimerase [Desulforegula conservatrix]
MYIVSPAEMAEMDRRTIQEFGVPGHTLMENAGRGAVEVFSNHFPDFRTKKICVICGKGNNGGDGLVMARYIAAHIQESGGSVKVFLLGSKDLVQGDAGINLHLLEKTGITVNEILTEKDLSFFESQAKGQDIFIDAIFGTGLNAPVKGIAENIICFLNKTNANVFSVDIPSGLDSETGKPLGTAIKASVTATFGFPKIGHAVYPGASYCGKTEIIDIGIPKCISESLAPIHELVTEKYVSGLFKKRHPETHKGTNGHVLVAGGSPGKSGAPIMTAVAALRTGAGLVTLALPLSLRPFAEISSFEIMTEAIPETAEGCIANISESYLDNVLNGKQVMAVGPGMDEGPETKEFLSQIIKTAEIPLVIDAGALNIIARNPDILRTLKTPAILTPHPGEMARLAKKTTSEIQEDRINVASSFAREYGIYLVLKGAGTVIASPDGRIMINRTGNPGLATAGTGDVLTGIIAGLVAQGLKPLDAAAAGVYIHGKTADRVAASMGPFGFIATDIISAIPSCIAGLVLNNNVYDFGFIKSFESLF